MERMERGRESGPVDEAEVLVVRELVAGRLDLVLDGSDGTRETLKHLV